MSFITSQLGTVLLLFLTLLFPNTRAQQTLFPAAIPLAVRSPYLSSWYHITNGTVFGQLWPATYNNPSQTLGWAVLVRVDGVTYSFLGDCTLVNGTVNLTDIVATPTQTAVTAQAGPMQVNLTFLNPIEPGDWVRQSIPFSYISFTAKSLDGSAHAVQLYTDLNGRWSTGERSQVFVWDTVSNSDVIYHSVKLQTLAEFNEINGQAGWGNVYYAIKSGSNVTYGIAGHNVARGMFQLQGVLDNQEIATPLASDIDAVDPVIALSTDLGTILVTQDPVVWTVGHITDPAISYTDTSGVITQRSLYYRSQYSDDGTLIVDFLNDFANASSRAQQLDKKILQDAASVSNPLGDLVSLAIAQVYGSTQLTIGTDPRGNFNGSDVMMFMKNIGGLVPNRVNAVETLYSAFPAVMYIDPGLGAPLLEPLLRLQASSNHSVQYAAADLGSSYPNVTDMIVGHNQGVEQSGNMLIMTYAHARATGDGSLISRYYPLLTSWADYLTNSTLLIHDQSSADGLTASNQTNLAIKGIIAIEAMSKMSSVIQQDADVNKYTSAAAQLYNQWKGLALSSTQHVLAAYGQTSTWTLGYNLFADVWLGTNLVDSSVFNAHSSFIDNMTLASSFTNFGMPVDNLLSDTAVAISGWNLFVAAMTPDGDLRSNLISRVYNRASFNTSSGVFPLGYNSSSGTTMQGVASPAQGAMFAPLALKAPVLTIKANVTTTSSPPAPSHTGTIAGAVTGGVVAALVVIGAIAFLRRRRRQRRRKSVQSSILGSFMGVGPPGTITPFISDPLDATPHGSGSQAKRRELLPTHPDAGSTLDSYSLSNTSTPALVHPLSPPVAPVPTGLSPKELARLRTEALSSQNTVSQSSSPQAAGTEQSDAIQSSEAQRLLSEFETLRHEMRQLRTERFEAPPSYTSGDI